VSDLLGGFLNRELLIRGEDHRAKKNATQPIGTIDKWAGRPTGNWLGAARPARTERKSHASRLGGGGFGGRNQTAFRRARQPYTHRVRMRTGLTDAAGRG
jgi:hypothetical protein